jgi:hypothetical protein
VYVPNDDVVSIEPFDESFLFNNRQDSCMLLKIIKIIGSINNRFKDKDSI